MSKPQAKFRKDYQAPVYLIDQVDLTLDVGAENTRVDSCMQVRRNPDGQGDSWRLDGRAMELQQIRIDGQLLAEEDFEKDSTGLILSGLPDEFQLEITNIIEPDRNTALEGFYRSGDILCTQCEATGFSRITYFPDRPDVLATYRCTLRADRSRYPFLLANGNRVDSGELEDGRHFSTWEDPYPKPCYLFAAVAGDLAEVTDEYVTGSGRKVDLRFYTDHGNEDRVAHAIKSLQQAMAWDEKVYGLEYDLDIYMVVAVGSFNMGAMENKGLNIFNSACVLASPETATDRDFAAVRDVVAHEYFHNYTGNRVTCKDWFQLSLKESLTVFREQKFAADHDSPAVQRIGQARMMREIQFPEDAGPTAHPVRPESYIEMNNFYTITIYEKGAEVIRMMHRLLGHEAFTRGVQHYLKTHDGQAVTIEDFVVALEAVSGEDLQQFRLWYSQAGTPVVTVRCEHDAPAGKLIVTASQATPPTPGQSAKQALHLPLAVAAFDRDSGESLLEPELLQLRKHEQQWTFDVANGEPVVSALRDFSAPARLDDGLETDDLAFLMSVESDGFTAWDAGQRLFLHLLKQQVEKPAADPGRHFTPAVEAVDRLLEAPPDDIALLAEMLALPTEATLADEFEQVDVDAVLAAHAGLKHALARGLESRWSRLLEEQSGLQPYRFDPPSVARRRIVSLCLDYLATADADGIREICFQRFEQADNMTDCMAALTALRDLDCEERDNAFQAFESRWYDDALVLDKWFALQATSRLPGTLTHVKKLMDHERFTMKNPNRVRALLGSFARGNMPAFHQADGAGYAFMAEQIRQLDGLNPQIAARMAGVFSRWRRFGERGKMMKDQLRYIAGTDNLSGDVYEIVTKSIEG